MAAAIEDLQPEHVVIENVRGLLSSPAVRRSTERAVLEVAAGVPVTEVAERYAVGRQSVDANLRQRQQGARQGEVMATFTRSDDLQGAEFVDADLRGARFVGADLSGVVMRGVDMQGTDIDAPWLSNGENFLRVNGVDVIPFVEAELNRRFPGRADRRAGDPDGLRAAWDALERTWAATLERVAAMPAGTVDVSVGGEWSFAQALRHLVLATDAWLGRSILGIEQPFHPIGQGGAEDDGLDMSIFATVTPSYAEVLEVRAGRAAMVRDFLATVTSDVLAAPRKNPWAPEYQETTLSCLHVILEEEWEHHRYAVRDLDAIEA
jgi:hypothetical protein